MIHTANKTDPGLHLDRPLGDLLERRDESLSELLDHSASLCFKH